VPSSPYEHSLVLQDTTGAEEQFSPKNYLSNSIKRLQPGKRVPLHPSSTKLSGGVMASKKGSY